MVVGTTKHEIPSADSIRQRLAQINREGQLLRRMLRMAKALERKANEVVGDNDK